MSNLFLVRSCLRFRISVKRDRLKNGKGSQFKCFRCTISLPPTSPDLLRIRTTRWGFYHYISVQHLLPQWIFLQMTVFFPINSNRDSWVNCLQIYFSLIYLHLMTTFNHLSSEVVRSSWSGGSCQSQRDSLRILLRALLRLSWLGPRVWRALWGLRFHKKYPGVKQGYREKYNLVRTFLKGRFGKKTREFKIWCGIYSGLWASSGWMAVPGNFPQFAPSHKTLQ